METREDVMAEGKTDLVLINPGGREHIYQELGGDLTAVEPPLWCRLIAGYVRDRGHSVAILDTEAEELGPDRLAEKVSDLDPSLVCVVVYGHQPSASTQQMVGARLACLALREQVPDRPVIIVGGHARGRRPWRRSWRRSRTAGATTSPRCRAWSGGTARRW
jgi:hypothetical protein